MKTPEFLLKFKVNFVYNFIRHIIRKIFKRSNIIKFVLKYAYIKKTWHIKLRIKSYSGIPSNYKIFFIK